jgi:drug/metabolite transporter (DMT)-like permease
MKTTQQNDQLIKYGLLALLSIIWGSSFMLIKKGLTGFDYIDAASMRMMAAGAVLLPLGLRNFTKVPRHQLPYIIGSGAIGMFIPAFMFCLAQEHITSTAAGILNALTPVFTFLFAIFLFKLPFKKQQGLGIFIGLASSVFLVVTRSQTALTLNIYALLPVLATMCYGMNVNISKEKLAGLSPMVIATTTVSTAGLLAFFLVFLPRIGRFQVGEAQIWPLIALLTLGVVGTAVAQILFLQLLSRTSSLFASSVTYLMPIVAIFWGLLDNEVFTWAHALGIAGIFAGVVLIRKG